MQENLNKQTTWMKKKITFFSSRTGMSILLFCFCVCMFFFFLINTVFLVILWCLFSFSMVHYLFSLCSWFSQTKLAMVEHIQSFLCIVYLILHMNFPQRSLTKIVFNFPGLFEILLRYYSVLFFSVSFRIYSSSKFAFLPDSKSISIII